MPISLSQFLTDIKTRGTVKPSRFDVVITGLDIPNKLDLGKLATSTIIGAVTGALTGGLRGALSGGIGAVSNAINAKNSRYIAMRCESISLPGVQILTEDYQPYGGLPPLAVPTSRVYDPIQCTFLCSRSFVEKQIFENWVHTITNFNDNNVAYYNDVCKNITVNIYDEGDAALDFLNPLLSKIPGPVTQGISTANNFLTNLTGFSFTGPTTLYSIQLIDAIPTRIESVDMAWNQTDDLFRFSVVFSYRQIKYTKQKLNEKFGHQNQLFT